ncbi:adenylyltransferase/cytidyltransferase family protein [Nocardioides humi]|uniref:Nicotinamide-nucleotide adenylyltransferase n=1 Tax=Nocardioides humi TaxID=449461 RepID=A0ABN2AGL3_9ACTN
MADIGCVTGRFQPFHRGHMELVQIALRTHEYVIVGVTSPVRCRVTERRQSAHRHLTVSNPYTYYQRALLISKAVEEIGERRRVLVVPFDLDNVDSVADYCPFDAVQYVRVFSEWERRKAEILRSAGFEVSEIQMSEKQVEASQIRALMRDGHAAWETLVPPSTVALLREWDCEDRCSSEVFPS